MNPARVIYADPAWPEKGLTVPHPAPGGKAGRADRHYGLSTLDEIMNMELPPRLPDGFGFIWCPVRKVESEGLPTMRAWGYKPCSQMIWVKTQTHDPVSRFLDYLNQRRNKELLAGIDPARLDELATVASCTVPVFGMGYYARTAHEVLLVGKRGRPGPPKRRNIRSVVMHPRGRHSEKPEIFADIIEAWSDGPYVELFARRERAGWTCLGDEL